MVSTKHESSSTFLVASDKAQVGCNRAGDQCGQSSWGQHLLLSCQMQLQGQPGAGGCACVDRPIDCSSWRRAGGGEAADQPKANRCCRTAQLPAWMSELVWC